MNTSAIEKTIIIYMAFIITVDIKKIQTFRCKKNCSQWKHLCKICEEAKTAVCSSHGRRLSEIPHLPTFVQNMCLDSDYFHIINAETFKQIHRRNMTLNAISFKFSQVHHISEDAFKYISSLKSLDLSSNRKLDIFSLKKAFAGLKNENLKSLSFKQMGWTYKSLSVQPFINLSSKNIDRVSLCQNNISKITDSSLEGLQMLKRLDLSYNHLQKCQEEFFRLFNLEDLNLNQNDITECNIASLPKSLRILRLENNRLENLPSFCSSANGSLLPALEKLRLEGNYISVLTIASFDCLQSLKYLDLEMNNIRRFPSRVFSKLLTLEVLALSNMKQTVRRIEDGAFSIPSLRKFYFDKNFYRFDYTSSAKRASLGNCSKLEHLDLSFNYMPKWPLDVKYILNGLTILRKIYLIQVYWNTVPHGLFKLMPNIEEVDLSSNGITNLNSSLFLNESKIFRMKLHNNRIAHVGPSTFPNVFWRSIKIIDLSANPYVCDCDLLWFRDLLHNSEQMRINFKRYPNEYRCLSPPERKGLKLANFNMTSDECKAKSELLAIGLTVGSLILVVLLIIFIVYKCRWHIRYWIYFLRYRKENNILLWERFAYDGFIIYSDEDSDFVHNILLRKLENENGFRMCVHFRDFQIGKMIVDNIVECMSQSRQALVVISTKFCQSRWCKFELLLAQDRWLRNEGDPLVIVMLEEVDSRHMTKDIRALIRTTTYCSWTENEVGQELFWEQLFSSLKKGTE